MTLRVILRYGVYTCFSLAIVVASLVIITTQRADKNFFESRYSFGIVPQGMVLTHSFRLINNYKAELRLVDIRPSCKCTTVLIGKKMLLPGEFTLLTMKFETKEYTGSREVNTFIRGIVENEEKLICNLILDATIEEVIEFSSKSYYLNLGEFELQDIPESKTFFVARGRYPLGWDSIKCKPSRDNLKSTVSKISPDRWKLDLQLNNENELGTIFNDLEFSFWKDGKECEYKLIKPVVAKILGPIMPSQSSLLVGAVMPNESVTKIIELRNRDADLDEPFEILSVDCSDSEWIKAEIIEVDSKPAIKVVFLPKDEYGAKFGEIIVAVTLGQGKVYKVRIDYLARVVSSENA